MSFYSGKLRAGPLLGLVLSAARLAGAAGAPEIEPLLAVRAKDQVIIYAGTNLLSLTETIVLEPVGLKPDQDRPGTNYVIELLIHPLFIKEGTSQRPAFPILRPRPSLSHGRVKRFALVKPDGETVNSIAGMTPDCAYVLTLEFGHVIPKRFTVTIDMATVGISRETQLTFMPSNDGQALRSGPPESTYTELRVVPGGALESWTILQGEKVLDRTNPSSVRLERGVNHTIRFGQNE